MNRRDSKESGKKSEARYVVALLTVRIAEGEIIWGNERGEKKLEKERADQTIPDRSPLQKEGFFLYFSFSYTISLLSSEPRNGHHPKIEPHE